MNSGIDYLYECVISADVLWLLYYKENEVIQDCPKMKNGKNDINVNEMLDRLTSNQRRIISAVCEMTEQKGASISVESVMNAVYGLEEHPESESFGKNVRTIYKKFASVGQELLFRFSKEKVSGGIIVSKVEKIKKTNDTSDSGVGKANSICDGEAKELPKKREQSKNSSPESSPQYISNLERLDGLVDERDAYYLSEIKNKAYEAIQLYDGDDRLRAISILQDHCFFMRKELSESAKKEIDNFFTTEFVNELIRQGLNEDLAQWYSYLWTLWRWRQLYLEKYERAKAEQDYDRMDMARRFLNRRENQIDEIIDKIDSYNNSLDNGGRI